MREVQDVEGGNTPWLLVSDSIKSIMSHEDQPSKPHSSVSFASTPNSSLSAGLGFPQWTRIQDMQVK